MSDESEPSSGAPAQVAPLPSTPAPSTSPTPPPAPGSAAPANLLAVVRTPGYLGILLVAAVIGAPISALAYGFIQLFEHLQVWLYESLPKTVGYTEVPRWWPVPLMLVGGVIVGLVIRFLPGQGGHEPVQGLSASPAPPSSLPGALTAALATLGFGLVLGPEAPLLALGGGLGTLAAQRFFRHSSPMTPSILGASGALAALGTILGSPLTAAFFLMEAIGLGGELLTLIVLPGLLAAGVGALVFIGLGTWTGLGSVGLAIPDLPPFARPTASDIGWCIVIGLGAALLVWLIRIIAIGLNRFSHPRPVLLTPVAGLVVAGLVVAYAYASGRPESTILYSGQSFIGPLVSTASTWAVGTLMILLVFKALAYAVSLSSFRGGPIFPALLLGAVIGVAASHLPGFELVPGIAAGMGAMTAAMLRLPVAAVLLPVLLLARDALAATPVVIVAVVVAFVITQYLPEPNRVVGRLTGGTDGQGGTDAQTTNRAPAPTAAPSAP
ncbi:MAG TPA: chloride channel protein [Acidimicrobiales bacterium]|nr:chloride channel protein [Acidimicrobiales bacterium]